MSVILGGKGGENGGLTEKTLQRWGMTFKVLESEKDLPRQDPLERAVILADLFTEAVATTYAALDGRKVEEKDREFAATFTRDIAQNILFLGMNDPNQPVEVRIGQTMGSKVKLDVALGLVYPDNQREYHAEVTRRLQELNDTVTRTNAPNLASAEKYPNVSLLNLQRIGAELM